MTNSRGNMEIMDVLSSIRRLVSEDRRSGVAERVEPALTGGAAVEVPPSEDASEEPVAQDVATRAEPVRRPGESRFVLTAALRVGDEGDALSAEPEPERADDPAGGDRLSLESTIAELEAAVAGIEQEFEPDGGDEAAHAELAAVGPMPAWPVADRADAVSLPDPVATAAADPLPVGVGRPMPEPQPVIATPAPDPSAHGFHGIMAAGFDPMASGDERLDLPITGDLTVPSPRRGEDWASAAALAGAGAFFRAASRSPSPAPRDAAGVTGTAEETEDVTPLPADGAAQDDQTALAADPAIALADPVAVADETDGGETEDARIPARPVILRARMPEADPEADMTTEDAGAEETPEAEDDDLTAVGHDPDGVEEPDLFDPLSGSDIDIDMLRDIVAEIVRDELRGTLGERITRNLRTLVRREIDRVLIAEGLKRD